MERNRTGPRRRKVGNRIRDRIVLKLYDLLGALVGFIIWTPIAIADRIKYGKIRYNLWK
jgi:hypothetical protein